jgi:hypothetical protein
LAEIYDTEVSRETISKITDQVLPDMVAWQSRPLDRVYPVLLIDAIVVKVRDSQVANRPVYVAIGVNLDGERDVLGLWLGPSGGEGAKQWMSMLTELRDRGVADALIVCCDGLKGLPDAIRVTWPNATVQTCVVHLVRNSCATPQRSTGQRSPGACERSTPHRPSRPPKHASRSSPMSGGRALPSDDRILGECLGGVRAVPRVPRRATKDRIYNQRDRVAKRQIPQGRPPQRPFPNEQAAMKVLYLVATSRRKNRENLTGKSATGSTRAKHPDHPLQRQTHHHTIANKTHHQQSHLHKRPDRPRTSLKLIGVSSVATLAPRLCTENCTILSVTQLRTIARAYDKGHQTQKNPSFTGLSYGVDRLPLLHRRHIHKDLDLVANDDIA